jgi:hypothetical protein
MSNKLFLGDEKDDLIKNDFSNFQKSAKPAVYIADELPIPDWHRPTIFNPTKHHLNVLKDNTYETRTDFVQIIDILFSRGDDTLTKDTGLDFIAECLEDKPRSLAQLIPRPGRKAPPGHIWAYNKMRTLLRSPVLNRVFDPTGTPFDFDAEGVVLAYINRRELRDFTALALGLFLMSHCKGQIFVRDGHFYLRDMHVNLLYEDRLWLGLTHLDQLKRKAPELRDEVVSIKDKAFAHVRYKDAIELAEDAGLKPDPTHTINGNPYDNFINRVMG